MMSYRQHQNGAQFIVSIIHNGKTLREFNEGGNRVIRIPFGVEYKIRIKSKYEHRALAHLSIDGMDVLTGGKKVVIPARGQVDVERFVDDLNEGKRFKFISVEEGARTGEIQDPTAKENGMIRVQIYPEKKREFVLSAQSCGDFSGQPTGWGGLGSSGILRGHININSSSNSLLPTYASNISTGSVGCVSSFGEGIVEKALVDKGATVEGSTSNQEFRLDTSNWETEAAPVTFDIWLRGPKSDVPKAASHTSFTVMIRNGYIWVNDRYGKRVETRYIGFDGPFVVIRTKDFAFANTFMKECVKLTDEGFEIRATGHQIVSE